jgi:hypothetical protein
METWAIVTLVLGSSAISALLTFFITRMQVSHSDKRFEKELEKDIVTYHRQRRWAVRGEPLLKLRDELALMATKQDRLVSAAHILHTRFFFATGTLHTKFGITKKEAQKRLQEATNDWNTYFASGEFAQTLFMQDDTKLVNKVDEIIRDYRASYFGAIYHKQLTERELEEVTKRFEKTKTRIIEVQSLINKRLEEL